MRTEKIDIMRRRRGDVVLVRAVARPRHDDLLQPVIIKQREAVRHEAHKRFGNGGKLLRDVTSVTVTAAGDDRRPEIGPQVDATSLNPMRLIRPMGKLSERNRFSGQPRGAQRRQPSGVLDHRQFGKRRFSLSAIGRRIGGAVLHSWNPGPDPTKHPCWHLARRHPVQCQAGAHRRLNGVNQRRNHSLVEDDRLPMAAIAVEALGSGNFDRALFRPMQPGASLRAQSPRQQFQFGPGRTPAGERYNQAKLRVLVQRHQRIAAD